MSLADHSSLNRLSDGRIQLRHGPIELVIEAFGSQSEVEKSYQQAASRFSTVLTELVDELSELRKPTGTHTHVFQGKIAVEMAEVASRFSGNHFVTPMIAVAGSVATHVLHAMTLGRELSRAYVNNGGDIALFLAKGQRFRIGVCSNPLSKTITSKATIEEVSGVRGIATSGWRGRSHSLGIADSVTVLARTAAMADAAATLIANIIDLPGHPMIKRAIANELNPDSDLGDRLVTVDVGEITTEEADYALELGRQVAQTMIDSKQIIGVYGSLNSKMFSLHPIHIDLLPNKPRFNNIRKEQTCA